LSLVCGGTFTGLFDDASVASSIRVKRQVVQAVGEGLTGLAQHWLSSLVE